MALDSQSTTAETERLISDQELSKSKVTAHGNSATGMSRTSASQDTPPEFKGETSGSGHHSRKRIIHFSSLSVDYRRFSDKDPIAGSAQISETDMGEENDFWNIDVDLIWKPRGQTGSKTDSRAEITHRSPVEVSVDDLLTVRICVSSNPACVTIHMRGGKPFGEFLFPNGPDAAMSFITALQVHVNTSLLQDENKPGRLYVVEKRHRMRRVAPSLTSLPAEQNRLDEDFSNLLDNLSLHDPGHSPRRNARAARATRRGRASAPDSKDFGMMLLSQFAKVTQAAREVGEDISMLLDERKRQAEADRKERERAARRRALDIYTDIVASTDVEGELPPRLCLDEKRGLPVSKQVWEQSFDDSGALSDAVVMKQAVFAGGVERNARKLIWPFLLGCYPWISTRAERNQIKVQHEEQYEALKEKWNSLHTAAKDEDVASQATIPNAETMDRRKRVSKAHADYLETNEQIAKDIVRTDRHVDLYMQENAPATDGLGIILNVYATYDSRITYCQGMSDFLSPIVHVLGVEEEALAFWCFEALMRRIEGNFRVDQSGMRKQLSQLRNLVEIADEELAAFFEDSDPDYYSCFRWIVVRFKRELPFESTARLWEVIWTRQVADDDFHIFIAAALLIAHRRQLLARPKGAFDCLLRYINDMSMRIDVDFALREGELCFRTYGKLIPSMDTNAAAIGANS